MFDSINCSDSIKLMKKDISIFYKINKSILLILIYSISMSSLILTSDLKVSMQMIMSATAYVVYAMVVGLISVEEKSNTSVVFKSLPVSKCSVVAGKYLFAVCVIVMASIVNSIIPLIKSIIEGDISYMYLSFINSFTFCIAVFSIFFPVFYKFGYLKMQRVNLLIFYGLIFVPMMLNLLRNIEFLKPLTGMIFVIVEVVIKNSVAALVLCLIIYLLSMCLSIKFENNK